MTTSNFNYADKIAKLLATAEGYATQGNEEAAATYLARASELQLQHMIDDSDIRQSGKAPDDPLIVHTVRGLDKGAAYIKAKRDLLYGLAQVFHCRVTIARDRSTVALYGYKSDIDFVQTLLDSLLIQMAGHMSHAAKGAWDGGSKSWKTSFAHGWASRVVARIGLARASQENAAADTPGTALVLRDRSVAVGQYFDQAMGGRKLGRSYSNRSIRSGDGLAAGYAAGDRADIGGKAVRNSRRELN